MNRCEIDKLRNGIRDEISGPSPEDIIKVFRDKYPKLCEAFSAVELEQLALFARKCVDYGVDNISGGTRLDTPEAVQFALNGIYYRMQDKLNRWKHCVTEGYDKLQNETLLDTFQDLANYAMIASLVARGRWHE